VRFHWTDYSHGHRVKIMTLSAAEFLRRFLLHVFPGGFVRIRHFGVLANRGRTVKLACCRAPLTAPPPATAGPEPVAALVHRLTGVDITRCPVCRAGRLRLVAVFRPGHLPAPALDTSCARPVLASPDRGAAPPRAEGRLAVTPRAIIASLAPPGAFATRPRPSRGGVLAQTPEKPFSRASGSDTIPIAFGPAVQFNPFYPAGLAFPL
jgi:hypothetical protein